MKEVSIKLEDILLWRWKAVAVEGRAGRGHCHRPAEPELVGHQGSEFELERDLQTIVCKYTYMCIVAILKFFSLLLNN